MYMYTAGFCRGTVSPRFSSDDIKYYSVENGQIKVGGKTYASLADLANNNHIKKRIFTIQEANDKMKALGGETFTFKMRYK